MKFPTAQIKATLPDSNVPDAEPVNQKAATRNFCLANIFRMGGSFFSVDTRDLQQFVRNFGATDCVGPDWCEESDMNRDGDSDGQEVFHFVNEFGRTDCPIF
jgi:hypothetical protein